MTGNPLRWAGPETASAWYDLRCLAPQLSGLIYCAPMPDGPLSILLDWSDAVGSDCSDAFAVERLRAVLPALVRALVASHTYSRSERGQRQRRRRFSTTPAAARSSAGCCCSRG
ncbi:MAG: hypothetical protein U1E59_21125 [Amaricoccus sp.]